MKKIVAIVLAVVLLATGGFGSFAYAQVNGLEPMTGQKLVGWGPVGLAPGSNAFLFLTQFILTNPDGVSEITIDRISVFNADGTMIYEGPLLVGMVGEELTEPLAPHQTVDIFLPYYILEGDPQAPWPESAYYTTEIFWTGTKNGLPLTGWSWMATIDMDDEGNYSILSTGAMSQMVNMEQELVPEKEEKPK